MAIEFWKNKQLSEMSDEEWESLCDGCARCCLLKLENEDTSELFFTNVSCHLLNIEECRCKDYENRKFLVPECLLVKNMALSEYQWLPETCAYRLLSEDKTLPDWHPLISGDKNSVKQVGVTVDGFAVSEDFIHPEQLEDHVINLPLPDE
ncbi:MAG: YcgN family cysteine cluster protein [Gammaproteobacteria bacterium]|nr:YcgN family cysteine cluster protein [Gammaproteobacteria bacterium]